MSTTNDYEYDDVQFSLPPEAEVTAKSIIMEAVLFSLLIGGLYTLFTAG